MVADDALSDRVGHLAHLGQRESVECLVFRSTRPEPGSGLDGFVARLVGRFHRFEQRARAHGADGGFAFFDIDGALTGGAERGECHRLER